MGKIIFTFLWGPFRPKVGIIAHLIVSNLLIYPFKVKMWIPPKFELLNIFGNLKSEKKKKFLIKGKTK